MIRQILDIRKVASSPAMTVHICHTSRFPRRIRRYVDTSARPGMAIEPVRRPKFYDLRTDEGGS